MVKENESNAFILQYNFKILKDYMNTNLLINITQFFPINVKKAIKDQKKRQ